MNIEFERQADLLDTLVVFFKQGSSTIETAMGLEESLVNFLRALAKMPIRTQFEANIAERTDISVRLLISEVCELRRQFGSELKIIESMVHVDQQSRNEKMNYPAILSDPPAVEFLSARFKSISELASKVQDLSRRTSLVVRVIHELEQAASKPCLN